MNRRFLQTFGLVMVIGTAIGATFLGIHFAIQERVHPDDVWPEFAAVMALALTASFCLGVISGFAASSSSLLS